MSWVVATDVVNIFSPAITTGFFFATAIAWVDVIRWTISQLVNVSKNGGSYYFLSAVFTTLLSFVVLLMLGRVKRTSGYQGTQM